MSCNVPGKFSPYDGDNHRLVPAFSVSSRQRNTAVTPPPPCEAFKVTTVSCHVMSHHAMQPRAPARSTFRQSYDRGDFPISLKHDGRGNRISWKVRIVAVDGDDDDNMIPGAPGVSGLPLLPPSLLRRPPRDSAPIRLLCCPGWNDRLFGT